MGKRGRQKQEKARGSVDSFLFSYDAVCCGFQVKLMKERQVSCLAGHTCATPWDPLKKTEIIYTSYKYIFTYTYI
jgi:hypothetical protein